MTTKIIRKHLLSAINQNITTNVTAVFCFLNKPFKFRLNIKQQIFSSSRICTVKSESHKSSFPFQIIFCCFFFPLYVTEVSLI